VLPVGSVGEFVRDGYDDEDTKEDHKPAIDITHITPDLGKGVGA